MAHFPKISLSFFILSLLILSVHAFAAFKVPDENGYITVTDADGTQLKVKADDDPDFDGIPTILEENGFVVDGGNVVAWDGDSSKTFYITDWRRASTDGDPYDDYTEATGANLPAGVYPPEDDPLVAARPRIVVKMTSYDVYPTDTITDSYGGAQGTSYTNETSNSSTFTQEVSTGVEVGTDGLNTNAQYSESVSETWAYSHSTTSSSELNWNSARTTQPDQAARLELQVYMENTGGVTALNVAPTVNLKLGDKVIETFILPKAESLTPTGTTTSRYPVSGTVNVGQANGNNIYVTMEELRAIQLGTPLTLEVTQVSADVVTIGNENNQVTKSWNNYISEIELVSMDVITIMGSGEPQRHQVFAGWNRWDPQYSIETILKRILDVQDGQGGTTINGRAYPDEWYLSSSSQKVIDEWENNGRPNNMLNLRSYPNTNLVLMSPGDDNTPVVNMASFSSLPGDTSAYSRALVSIVPSEFPISRVTATVPMKGGEQQFELTANDYGFYVNADPFTSVPVGEGKVVVRNAKGDETEKAITFPAIYSSAEDVRMYSRFIPNPGGQFWINAGAYYNYTPILLYCQFWDPVTGDSLKPARTFIDLPNTGGAYNFADWLEDTDYWRTHYTKIAVDPTDNLVIDVEDTTFAQTQTIHSYFGPYSGRPMYGMVNLTYSHLDTAYANIDLTGTPFQIWRNTQFDLTCPGAQGIITVSRDWKTMNVMATKNDSRPDTDKHLGVIGDFLVSTAYRTVNYSNDNELPGNAVTMNQSDSSGYVNLGENIPLPADQFTIECWVYPTGAHKDTTYGGIILNDEGIVELAQFPDSTVRFAIATTTPGWTWVNTGYKLPDSLWTKIAFVYNQPKAEVRIYFMNKNGNRFQGFWADGPISDRHPDLNEFRVGGRQSDGGSQYFNGMIDELRIWKYAEDVWEINYNNYEVLTYFAEDSGLLGYWRFDELEDLGVGAPGANDIRDYSFFANHGELVGDAHLSSGIPAKVEDGGDKRPTDYVLEQNYPNPFNPVTTISYSLPTASDVELTIYNMTGQRVVTLQQGRQDAGSYRLQWHGNDQYSLQVSSGVYFYRLTTGTFTETKKMVLMR